MRFKKILLLLVLAGITASILVQPSYARIPDEAWYEDRYVTLSKDEIHYLQNEFLYKEYYILSSSVTIHERWKHTVYGDFRLWKKWHSISQTCMYVIEWYGRPIPDSSTVKSIATVLGFQDPSNPLKLLFSDIPIEPAFTMWQKHSEPQYGSMEMELMNGYTVRWEYLGSINAYTFSYDLPSEITVYSGDIMHSRILLDDLSPVITLENTFTYS